MLEVVLERIRVFLKLRGEGIDDLRRGVEESTPFGVFDEV